MLTLRFIPYQEIEHLSSEERVGKLINIVKTESIILMQGRLKPVEEVDLIQQTMTQISKKFKGIEICTIYPEDKHFQFFKKIRMGMLKFLLGHREGITIIGPASVVKEIKRDPNNIQLYILSNNKGKRRR